MENTSISFFFKFKLDIWTNDFTNRFQNLTLNVRWEQKKSIYCLSSYLFSWLDVTNVFLPGTGYAQAFGAACVLSYYVSIVGLCLYYLAMSFQATLPWAECRPEWINCVESGVSANRSETPNATSSAEYYFT